MGPATVDREEPRLRLQQFIDGFFEGSHIDTVLDAGAGHTRQLELPAGAHLVALDISPDELARNEDADEKIVGDLQTADLHGRTFDLVICWDVLEHLAKPEAAVSRLASWLRPGGALVVGVPNLWSTKGMFTKLTPYSLHSWVYRRLLGAHGLTPFRTYLRISITPRNLAQQATQHGLARVYSETYAGGVEEKLPHPLSVVVGAFSAFVRTATRGHVDPSLSEYVAVFEKLEGTSGSSSGPGGRGSAKRALA
jgi:SAM-dependent methyltransferase